MPRPCFFLQQGNFVILKLCAVQRNILGKQASYDAFQRCMCLTFPEPVVLASYQPELGAGRGGMVPIQFWQMLG